MPDTANLTNTFYAATGGRNGYGSQLKVGDGASPEVFEALGEVTKITFGDLTTSVLTRTHLRSPDGHHEKLAGIQDSGPFQLEMNWRPTHVSQSNSGGGSGAFASGGLLAMKRARAEHNFILVYLDTADADTLELPFAGIVTKYQPGEVSVEGSTKLMVEITPVRSYMAALP